MEYGKQLYGVTGYAAPLDEEAGEETRKPDLLEMVPAYYQTSRVMRSLLNAQAEEVGLLYKALDETLQQFFVETATWGLARWEEELGLVTAPSQTFDRRREMIKAKLRGAGTTTPQMIQRVASAFSGGEVEVVSVPSEYRFIVRFIGILGIPPNMAGLIQMLEEIKPAHLAYTFDYTYSTWGMIKPLTMGQVKPMTWSQVKAYGGG